MNINEVEFYYIKSNLWWEIFGRVIPNQPTKLIKKKD